VLKLEREINGHCMLKLFCFPFGSALLERALHQMSAAIQIDLRNSRMTNLNKRPDAKYQEGVYEGSNADLENSATGNRVEQGAVSHALFVSY
jgi:hypothetical protein